MNLSPTWVKFLRDSGFDSAHWSEIGHASAPDSEIMNFAYANGLVTHDLDFGALLASRKASRPSVIQVRAQSILPTAIGDVVLRALRGSRLQLEIGALVTVDPNRSRIRLLPL